MRYGVRCFTDCNDYLVIAEFEWQDVAEKFANLFYNQHIVLHDFVRVDVVDYDRQHQIISFFGEDF